MCYAAVGSPNFSMGYLAGDSCFCPRSASMASENGDFMIADCSQQFEQRYDESTGWRCPEVIVNWGCNAVVSNSDNFYGHWIVDCMQPVSYTHLYLYKRQERCFPHRRSRLPHRLLSPRCSLLARLMPQRSPLSRRLSKSFSCRCHLLWNFPSLSPYALSLIHISYFANAFASIFLS